MSVEKLLNKARHAASMGDLESAIHMLSDFLEQRPTNLQALLARARFHLDCGQYEDAQSDIARARQLHPDEAAPHAGDYSFALKQYAFAIREYDFALRIDPEHALALCRRGISRYYLRQYDKALQDLQRAQELDPSIPNIHAVAALQAQSRPVHVLDGQSLSVHRDDARVALIFCVERVPYRTLAAEASRLKSEGNFVLGVVDPEQSLPPDAGTLLTQCDAVIEAPVEQWDAASESLPDVWCTLDSFSLRRLERSLREYPSASWAERHADDEEWLEVAATRLHRFLMRDRSIRAAAVLVRTRRPLAPELAQQFTSSVGFDGAMHLPLFVVDAQAPYTVSVETLCVWADADPGPRGPHWAIGAGLA